MVLAHIAAKDIPKDCGLKGAPIGLENTMVIDVIPHKGLQIFKKIDLLSQIDIFDGLSLKSARDLIQCSTEEHYKSGQIVSPHIPYKIIYPRY